MVKRTSLLYQELIRLGPLSNQELCRVLELSPGGITQLLKPLIHRGLFTELAPQSYPEDQLQQSATGVRSRRKSTFTPRSDHGYSLVGIFQNTTLFFYKLDFNLQPDSQVWKIELHPQKNIPDQIVHEILRIQSNGTEPLLALGFTVSGRVQLSNNRIVYSNQLSYLVDMDLSSEMETRLGVPTVVLNDSHALGVGERYTGDARQMDHFFTLFIDQGVGLGIVINGEPYQGFEDLGGEAGQTILVPFGKSHRGTVNGSFEAYVSQEALWNQIRSLAPRGSEQTAYKVLAELIHNDNPRALEIIDDIAEKIGLLCTNLMLLFSPHMIFLTGPLALLESVLPDRLKMVIRRFAPRGMGDSMGNRIRFRLGWQERMAKGTALKAFAAYLDNLDHHG